MWIKGSLCTQNNKWKEWITAKQKQTKDQYLCASLQKFETPKTEKKKKTKNKASGE